MTEPTGTDLTPPLPPGDGGRGEGRCPPLPEGAGDRGGEVGREPAALDWLYGFSDWERGVGWNQNAAPAEAWKLGRTRSLLDLAGAPDQGLRIVHVAGTKGKGSTAAYLESTVRAAGWRVGTYAQPHLHVFRERIRLDGRPLDAPRFVALVDRLRGLVEQFQERHPDAGAPTTFELTTVLAVLAFAEAGVDLAIAEVGLGGRLDATNALATDLAVVTPIGLDHRQILGRTLREIAAEKAGIIRPGQTVISALQRPSARAVIVARCAELGATVRFVRPLSLARMTRLVGSDDGLGFGAGRHQRQNAAVAMAAAEALTSAGLPLTRSAVRHGLAGAWLPARLEVVRRRPRVLVDAAHNVDSARALAAELRGWTVRPRWLVLGILRDKDARAILRVLLPLADGVVVAAPASPRALPADRLAAACASVSATPVEIAPSVAAALERAVDRAGAEGGVAVAGSFTTAAEARAALGLADVLTAEDRAAWLARGGR